MYLQKGDVNSKTLKKDTVVRTYAVDSFRYKIQPNDIISVRMKSLTDKDFDFFSGLTTTQGLNMNAAGGVLLIGELVDPQGNIPFPVIGKVKVAGMTIFEVEDSLQALAEKYFESPIVKVRLINYHITILGEVDNEGLITLSANRTTMLEAIGHAGLGELADRSNIKILRQTDNTVDVAYINLLDENFVNSPYYYVHQNDVLIVPPLKQRPFRKYFGPNLALFVSSISILLLTLNLIK